MHNDGVIAPRTRKRRHLPRNTVWAEAGPLVALSIPVVAGLAGATALSVIDSWMLAPLGTIPLAAASLTQSVLVILYAGLYGFIGAVGPLAGHAHGADEPHRLSDVLLHGLLLGLAGGFLGACAMADVLYLLPYAHQPPEVLDVLPHYWLAMSAMLVPYTMSMVIKLFLDSIGRPWTSAFLTLLPIPINIPLNWLLIYGNWGFPQLGLLGAGIASLAAVSGGLFIMLLYLMLAPSMAVYRRAFRFRRRSLNRLTREGVPMAIQYVSEGGAVAIAGILIGLLGATALAANQIVFSLAVLIYMAPLGMAAAVSIRISQAIGEGAPERARAVGIAGLAVVSLWMVGFTVLMVGWGEHISRLFIDEPDVIAAATAIFVTVGIMQIFDGLQSVGLGALRGLLDNDWPTRVSLVAYWLVALPLSIVFGFTLNLGAPGVWAGFGVGLAVAALLLVRRFLRLTRPARRAERRR